MIDNTIDDLIERINFPIGEIGDPPLYDLDEAKYNPTFENTIEEDISKEIALVVRCNKNPEQLLYQEGRALRPLSDEERFDVSQLFHSYHPQPTWQPTYFLIEAVSKIFDMYCAKVTESNEEAMLTASGVAAWMTVGMGRVVGKNDMRVSLLISNEEATLTASGVAAWMTVGMGRVVGKNDMRVSLSISKYSSLFSRTEHFNDHF